MASKPNLKVRGDRGGPDESVRASRDRIGRKESKLRDSIFCFYFTTSNRKRPEGEALNSEAFLHSAHRLQHPATVVFE
ncbi:hypothetical protein NPIL_188071, partial [Nephila pilipes]